MVSQEVLARIRSSFEHFRNEAGAQMDHLKDVRGMIVGGVGNLEQTAGAKLAENAERDGRQEQVLDALRNTMQEISGELGEIEHRLSKPRKN